MVQDKPDDVHLLVSLSNSKGQNFILKLSVVCNVLKILVTDKATAEKWKCAYDSAYIENLSRKTGNFKQFMVFVSMLKAGLLKTNECVFVELLTQEELELRRKKCRRIHDVYYKNRKYLILVYQVEFDKIHYPLPLEYCGKPDPEVLQNTIRKLENDINQMRSEMAKQMLKVKSEADSREASLQRLVDQLNNENKVLYEEVTRLKKQIMEDTVSDRKNQITRNLEAQMMKDRAAYKEEIYRLEIENKKLTSILTNRATRSRVPGGQISGLGHSRSPSLPRSSSSFQVSNRQTPSRRTSPSPNRKPYPSSSSRSSSLRRSKSDTERASISSGNAVLSPKNRKDSNVKKFNKTKSKCRHRERSVQKNI